jgi:Mg-chelatase subunit ChlD
MEPTQAAMDNKNNANNFEVHKGDQFILAVDTSGSMQNTDTPSGENRFKYTMETFKVFVREAAKLDPDGVSFYSFANNVDQHPDVSTIEEVDALLKKIHLGGSTATDKVIKAAYTEHKSKGSAQTLFILFTDGEPSDPDAVKKTVIDITNDVKSEMEFRISILTVGDRSAELDQWLNDLDEHLTGAKYDIIDVSKLEDVDFMTACSNAIEGGHVQAAA